MKSSTTGITAFVVAVAAFLIGRMSSDESSDSAADAPQVLSTRVRDRHATESIGPGRAPSDAQSSWAVLVSGMSEIDARQLSSEERLRLLKRGAMIWNSGNQSAALRGLIGGLTKEEMSEATSILGAVQDSGNYQAQEVWDALWVQWGRVNPAEAMVFFEKDGSGKSKSDARNMMTGWLETDPIAAFAWAKTPKSSELEASAAALAITSNANGDPQRMAASILELPADEVTRKACLQDYFDLTTMVGDGQTTAETYDQLEPALQSAGWSVAMERLFYEDDEVAKNWLESHADDAGRDYSVASRFMYRIAAMNPLETVEWAASLPGIGNRDSGAAHPVDMAVAAWLQRDRPAATKWLEANTHLSPSIQGFLDQE